LEAPAVTANDLLLWMSARGQGSWSQFRAAVEELHIAERENTVLAVDDEEPVGRASLPLHQSLRLNFQRLAHAEFFAGAGGDDWRVTPPCLSIVEHSARWLAVVTGARSDQLIRRLHSVAGPFEIETVPLEACPDRIRLVARDAAAFSGVARCSGMLLQSDAPLSLLTGLPAVDHPAVRRPADLPFGASWRIEQFSTRTLGWKVATREMRSQPPQGSSAFHSLTGAMFCSACMARRIKSRPRQVNIMFSVGAERRSLAMAL
jgi:hypothetical protein